MLLNSEVSFDEEKCILNFVIQHFHSQSTNFEIPNFSFAPGWY